MPMIMSVCYSVITEESAEHGDFADTGFEVEPAEVTVAEAVHWLRQCVGTSCRPLCDTKHACWAETEAEQDMFTGDWTSYTVHLSGITPHQRRRLFKLAGLVR